ncbi:hypothetical protein OZ411_39735 [Bradyrhizobium sp. Arg237L]|uniref:hypothetical protein n=1 Tax=Bradyrhizobium sp. Arg237L TaxID=3003352 RepID=UPI00249DC3EB|nr:hypothetical protein [Bradyrhizobium sp. Arg237L]MDI4238927.1 hypothetical protein [Bradyrhizobium sp. Arg237L]
MPVDHVQFCTKKYLKNSYGFRAAAVRPDLVEKANGLLTANATGIGAALGVQTIAEDSDEIAFIVGENGLFLADIARGVSYSSIVGTRAEYQDKQEFRAIDLDLDDGSSVKLKVESGHGKLRDAFAVSSFLRHLLQRLKQDHPAYQPYSG